MALIAGLGLFFTSNAGATGPTINEYQALAFGEMTVTSTASSDSLIIGADGAESHGPNITPLLPGHNAFLRLTGFPANTIISAMADNATLDRQPSGASFDIGSYTFDPNTSSQVTDGTGQMALKIGATLSTRAGVTYQAGPYRGTYNLLVNY